jgi:hypothetical protein
MFILNIILEYFQLKYSAQKIIILILKAHLIVWQTLYYRMTLKLKCLKTIMK